MSTIIYAMSNFDILLVIDGKVNTIGLSHPMYLEICKALSSGDRERAVSLLDVKQHVEQVYGNSGLEAKVIEEKSGAITIEVEGHKLEGEIAKTLVMYKQAGLPLTAIVKFWKKFTANAKLNADEEYVRKQDLLRFLKSAGLYLLPNGNFIAFKGVMAPRPGEKAYRSWYKETFTYELNKVAVEPAAKNISDVHVACGVGLHAGSISFAKSYGDLRLAVEIDPADVVTVPTGADSHLRCWRMIPRVINPDDTAPVKNFIRLDRPVVVRTDVDEASGTESVVETAVGAPQRCGIKLRLESMGSSKINAIKVVRETTGRSLADAKYFVEGLPQDLKKVTSFAEASEIVKKFDAIGAKCVVVGGMTAKTTAPVKSGRVRDRSKEKKKVRWYKVVGGKLLCERKTASPGPEWSADKAAVVAKLSAKIPGAVAPKKPKVAVMKALMPKRTYYRVLADGRTVETVRADKRPPGFTGERPAWFTKKK